MGCSFSRNATRSNHALGKILSLRSSGNADGVIASYNGQSKIWQLAVERNHQINIDLFTLCVWLLGLDRIPIGNWHVQYIYIIAFVFSKYFHAFLFSKFLSICFLASIELCYKQIPMRSGKLWLEVLDWLQ